MRKAILTAVACAGLVACLAASAAAQSSLHAGDPPGEVLPLAPEILAGKLSNGISYYIRPNKKPEQRAELRLVVNAGSVLENDDQQGLAHFAEHMAFNGTRDFKKQDIVNYLESVGVRFGADLNAYTSFDETVYMLQIPTDTPAIVEKGFDILENWAHLVTYDDTEIDKERGVVIEEWRLGRGANARMRDKQFPILFKNSRYADRLPIGQKHILESFDHETLRTFYRDWYRPDLMAVIAVGDFDPRLIENLIRKHFSEIPPRTDERKRHLFPVPGHPETLFAIATDPEATITNAVMYFTHDVESDSTVTDYRRDLVEGLYDGMLNDRLSELTRQSDPPFLSGGSFKSRIVRTKDFYALGVTVKDGGVQRGFDALLTEALRLKRFGFTQSELDRQKKDMLRGMESAFEERDKTESESFASELIRHFLNGEPAPGIAYEFGLYKRLLPGITLAEVNALAATLVTDSNRVVTVSAPQKAGVQIPTAAELTTLIDSVARKTIQPYIDKVSAEPLVPNPPKPGTIVARETDTTLGLTVWSLSNGVRVVLKPTDFKNDEILFSGFGPGGLSLAPDSDLTPAATATAIIQEGGVGHFDRTQLQKMLAGKLVSVSPYIGELEQGFRGSASPQDIATLFQLAYLYVTSPRMDSTAFGTFRDRFRGVLQNRSARPESAFEDTLQVTLSQHHPRRRPFTEARLTELNLRKSYAFYQSRFADAGEFTFLLVGNLHLDDVEHLITTYLGSLPSLPHHESWIDRGIEPPGGVVTREVRRGLEPKSQVRLIFTGPFKWSNETRYALSSLADVMRIKLREALREEKGGTYGVGIGPAPIHYPKAAYRLSISFGCAPERVEELTKTVFEQIDSVARFGIAQSYLTKVKETQLRERETALKENSFWLNTLQFYLVNGEPPSTLLETPALIEKLSTDTIRNAARNYFNETNYVKAVLYPENQ